MKVYDSNTTLRRGPLNCDHNGTVVLRTKNSQLVRSMWVCRID